MTAVVWPDGLDRSILHSLPISVRTRNCLLVAELMEGNTPLRAVDLLDLPNFGRTSLEDLLLNVEKFLLDRAKNGNAPSSHLSQPSRDTARSYLAQISPALHAAHEGSEVSWTACVWPDGLERSILHSLSISVRTHNCLQRAKLMEGNTSLKAADLLRLQNFGRTSLADLLLNVEKFLVDCARNGNAASSHSPRRTEKSPENASESTGTPSQTETENSPWNHAGESLLPLLATSAELLGTRTLADALHPDLLRLASRMRLAPALHAIGVHEIIERAQSLPTLVATRLNWTLEAASERERTVIQTRMIQAPPATLEEVGLLLTVTRERVRQMQVRLERKVEAALGEELSVIAATLKEGLDPIVPALDLEQRIEGVVPKESTTVYGLFRKALISAMDFTTDNGVYIDDQATEVLREVRTGAQSLADDVGLVREEQLIEILPHEGWRRFWRWLRERSGLHDLHGMLALRDTARARAKAALMSIGRSATREEIASVCGFDDSGKVGAALSSVPSVARADKERWGLREWIDDEYDGIVGEIIQRIEEDGGTTTTERLLTELPRTFKVSPASVRAYMYTPRFEIRDGSISLASASAVQLRHLDDVIHGRDESGAPYWTFLVESRYFEGYSVIGVPPEFAKALGCSPDSGLGVRIDNLPNCRELSLRWRLSSINGATLGYVSEPLRQLGLQPGDHARVTIVGTSSVELSVQDNSAKVRQPTGGGWHA